MSSLFITRPFCLIGYIIMKADGYIIMKADRCSGSCISVVQYILADDLRLVYCYITDSTMSGNNTLMCWDRRYLNLRLSILP